MSGSVYYVLYCILLYYVFYLYYVLSNPGSVSVAGPRLIGRPARLVLGAGRVRRRVPPASAGLGRRRPDPARAPRAAGSRAQTILC